MTRSDLIKGLAITSALFAATTPALAGTASGNLSASATISATCTVTTAAVAFATISTLTATPDDSTGTLTVTCTNGAAWSAAAGAGGGTGATVAVRKMTSGANTLNYALYKDSGRTTLWGDGTLSTATITGTGTGAAQANTIYARVPGSQSTAPTGAYADTVAITVTF